MDPQLAWFILLNPLIATALIHLVLRQARTTSMVVSVGSAAFGLLAVALQIVTISRPFFGAPVVFFLLAPLGLASLSVALWLLIKDFPNNPT